MESCKISLVPLRREIAQKIDTEGRPYKRNDDGNCEPAKRAHEML